MSKNLPITAESLGFAPEEAPAPALPEEISFHHQEVYQLAGESLDFLAAIAMPGVTEYLFPPVFVSLWQLLRELVAKPRDFTKLALGLPRGFGKTTLMKLFILYCVLFTQRKFILIIASNSTLAANILADVCDFLDEPNIKRVFGDWRIGIEKDTQNLIKFGFRGRNLILAAIGQGSGLRGMNLKNERPDVMIFEDIQTREDADSQTTSDAIYRWMLGTAMKAKSPTGCLYIFVGNMYPTKHSILRQLKHNPSWIKFIAGGILADGTSLWEDLQPVAQLLEEYQADLNSGHPEIFYSEVLNDENASVNTNIDIGRIPEFTSQDEISVGSFIIIDPSNDKANSDDVSIGYFEVLDTKPALRELVCGRFSPSVTIQEALKLAGRRGCSLIVIEANAYQYSLLYWFEFICQQLGLTGIECVPIYSGALSKNTRILNMFKSLLSGDLLIDPAVRPLVYSQITSFNALKRDNVDGILDLLTYAPRVLQEFAGYIAINANLDFEQPTRVWLEEENCVI